jgi:hypothetical protein
MMTNNSEKDQQSYDQGRSQDFKLLGAHLKKLRRAEGGAKIVGAFRVKNHDFTPKNHILGGGGRRVGAPPLDPPLMTILHGIMHIIIK